VDAYVIELQDNAITYLFGHAITASVRTTIGGVFILLKNPTRSHSIRCIRMPHNIDEPQLARYDFYFSETFDKVITT
jgi:hypothetical protein